MREFRSNGERSAWYGVRSTKNDMSSTRAASPAKGPRCLLKKRTIERPYSYQVQASRFPKKSVVFRLDDPSKQTVASELPLADDIPVPFGSVRTGRRTDAVGKIQN